ncbi:hypothetical protein [Desulfomicrobium salsuginis]
MTEAIERTSPTVPAARNEAPRRDQDRPSPTPPEPTRPSHDPHKGSLVDVFA